MESEADFIFTVWREFSLHFPGVGVSTDIMRWIPRAGITETPRSLRSTHLAEHPSAPTALNGENARSRRSEIALSLNHQEFDEFR